MKILFNDFKKEYSANRKNIDSAIKRVLESGYFILGKEVLNFEKTFADYVGVKHAVGVGNGLEALQISLMAIDIKPGDEIITTSLSAVATSLAEKILGAKPIFADIDKYYHLDPNEIEKKISKKTKAIIPVHLYGQSADMKKIGTLSKKYNVPIIEDCAQANGVKFGNRHVGSFGLTGCFSFYPTKNLGAYGDGGMIVTDDDGLAEKMRMMRNYGQSNRYEHPIEGINSRLDEIQAAILGAKILKLDALNQKRTLLANTYRNELKSVKEIKLPLLRGGSNHVYHLFVIEAERRDELQSFLKEHGIPTLIHYPIPIHKQIPFLESSSVSLPRLEKATQKILSLPCHPYLSESNVQFICSKIKSFYEK